MVFTKTMPVPKLQVLIETGDKADARFIAAWLTKAAEAQTLWSRSLDEVDFADRAALLHVDGIPDLEAAALEFLGDMEHSRGMAVIALYPDDDPVRCYEFGMLERLGFFVIQGLSYHIKIPHRITLAAVKQAASDILSTDAGEGAVEVLRPELLVQTMTKAEAEAKRSIMMAIRRFRIITG